MAMQRTLPMPRRIPHTPPRRIVSVSARTGLAMSSFGAMLAIATVWLEEHQNLDFAVGLTIGIALLPWIMTFMPAGWKLLPQPGALCALVLSGGVLVGLAGLYSGRTIHFSTGS